MKKIENFFRSLDNLREIFQVEKPSGIIETTGMVALFEVCFEQSWKAMKAVLEDHGYGDARTGSPRHVIKTAYQAHMIDDETLWLNALEDRNNVTHTYNEDVALAIIRNAKERYYQMFADLRESLEKNWL